MELGGGPALVVVPMTRTPRPPAQAGLWGPDQPIPDPNGRGYLATNDLVNRRLV
jgi:hypothetical protein